MKKIVPFFCLFFLFIACDNSSKIEKEIAKINVDFSVLRFDLDYKNATPQDLPQLKDKYPYMFSDQYNDSVWIFRMTDTLQRSVFNEVYAKFPDFTKEEKELTDFFKHVKYYYPTENIPTVVTVTSDVDYKHPVYYTKDYLIISLDTYLGTDHMFYENIPTYVTSKLNEKYMLVDVAAAFAAGKVAKPRDKSFLSIITWFGKQQYVESLLVPNKTETERLKYTEDEYAWAEANEDMIWQYFVENEVLYSNNPKMLERFVTPAPFSKFYLPVDNESPGRLGVYIGTKIVAAYMQNNNVSLQQMLNMSAEEIFKNAHYKPKK